MEHGRRGQPMNGRRGLPRRRLPISELIVVVALAMAVIGLVEIDTVRGRWATAGALVLGWLAGLEIRSRERDRGGRRDDP